MRDPHSKEKHSLEIETEWKNRSFNQPFKHAYVDRIHQLIV